MSESKTSERRLAAAEKQRQALELRKAGVGFVKIAEILGYKGPSGAFQAVSAALARTLRLPAEQLRAVEEERLDMALEAIAGPVREGNLKAVDRWLRCSESRRKLLGLDAPERQEVKGTLGLQVVEEVVGAGGPAPDGEDAPGPGGVPPE
jgi:PAS domain-containing protein